VQVDRREPAAVFAGGILGALARGCRHVPHVTVLVATPERTAEWFAIVDELTAESGLVTSEIVPSAG
jgi:hypothetical protein